MTDKEQMELERILNRHGAESGELTEALITDLLAWHEQEVEKRVREARIEEITFILEWIRIENMDELDDSTTNMLTRRLEALSPDKENRMTASNDELREKLATIEHERWSDWQKYVHSLMGDLVSSGNKSFKVLDRAYYLRWERQIATPYDELSDEEKASDMEQVDRYWPLIQAYITADREALLDRLAESFDTHTVPESPCLLDRQYVKNTIEFERKRSTSSGEEVK